MSDKPDYTAVVKKVLETYPLARDDDRALYAAVLMSLGCDPVLMSVSTWLDQLARSTLPTWDTVTRLRRQVQEQYSGLRGKLYEQRHALAKDAQAGLGHNVMVDEKQLPLFKQ